METNSAQAIEFKKTATIETRDIAEPHISCLPEELVIKILSYLSPYEHCESTSLVCKLWHRLVKSVIIQTRKYFSDAIKKGEIAYKENGQSSSTQSRLRVRHRPLAGGLGIANAMGQVRNRSNLKHRQSTQNDAMQTILPSARFSHSSCVLGKYLYIFGGSTDSNSAFNDLYKLNLTNQKWERLIMKEGIMPTPRECCCMVPYKNNIVLFGGGCQPRRTDVTIGPRFFSDIFIIDRDILKCNKINVCEPWPCERAGHNVCIVKDTLVIFGGCGAQRSQRFNDVWIFDLIGFKWLYPQIHGKKPAGRFGHSQFAINETDVLIVGGCGGPNERLLDDVWLLDTTQWAWCEIVVKNKLRASPQTWSHPAVKVEDQIVNFSDQVFCRNCYLGRQLGSVASPLMVGQLASRDMSTDIETDEEGKVQCQLCARIINADQCQLFSHLHMYVLDCSEIYQSLSVSWKGMPLLGLTPVSRTFPSVTVGKGEIFIFGGVQDSKASNDLIVISTKKSAA